MNKSLISLIVIIAIAAVAGGVSVIMHTGDQPAPTISYVLSQSFTDHTGAFSFKYPVGLSATTNGETVILNDTGHVSKYPLVVMAMSYGQALSTYEKSLRSPVTPVKVGNVQADRVVMASGDMKALMYIIPVDRTIASSPFLAIVKYGDDSSVLSDDQFNTIVSSVTIDHDRIVSALNKVAMTGAGNVSTDEDSLAGSREKGVQARVRTDLMQMRTVAEVYYSPEKEYAGFCDQKQLNSNSSAKAIIADIATYRGANGFICHGTKTAYAMSVVVSSSTVMCLDSLGQNVNFPASTVFGTTCGVSKKI